MLEQMNTEEDHVRYKTFWDYYVYLGINETNEDGCSKTLSEYNH